MPVTIQENKVVSHELNGLNKTGQHKDFESDYVLFHGFLSLEICFKS